MITGVIKMILHKLPIELQSEVRTSFYKLKISNALTLEEEIQIFAEELKSYFSNKELEQIARQVGFVQREGKLKAWHFLFLCSFIGINVAKDTLGTLCSKIGSKLKVIVSNQAIDKRFSQKCVEFIKNIFEKLLKSTVKSRVEVSNKFDEHFNRIRILDSTGFQLPDEFSAIYPGSGGNSTSAGAKIQLEFELKSGEFLNVDVGSGKDSDCTYGKSIRNTIEELDLILRDLGYFNLDDYEDINKRGAFYISRVKLNTATYILRNADEMEYFKNGLPKKSSMRKRIDFSEIMNNMKEGETIEIKEAFVGDDKMLPVRLTIYKHTTKELEKITESAKKDSTKKGKTKSDKTMDLLGLCILMTNIPDEIIAAKQLYEIYSLRWQVELIFKTWKSVYNIAKVRNVKIERFKCQLYGKLILVLLSSTVTFRARAVLLINQKKEISEIKVSRIVCEYFESLYSAIICSPKELVSILECIFETIIKNGKKSRKKNKRTVFDIIGVSYEEDICHDEVSVA
jgi:hypothetical protein